MHSHHSHIHTDHTSYDEAGRMMRLASRLSLIAGVILVVFKGMAWLLSDSLSMMSSLADSMLDVMASTINFVAVRYALQPPDKEHRFGHGKAEDLSALAQSTFICGSGAFLIIEGVKRLFFPEEVSHGFFSIVVMFISIAITFGLVMYQRFVVRKTSSSAIASDAMHYFADLMSNIGVVLAIFLTSSLGWKKADPIVGILIAFYIIYNAIYMGLASFHNLMDHEFSDAERTKIKEVVRAVSEVQGLHELRTRRSGINSFIQFHLTFIDEDISLRHAHEIADQIEDELKLLFPHTEILIHQDTLHSDREPPKEH